MNWELSSDDCVKLKPLFTLNPTLGAKVDKPALGSAEKNPLTEFGALLKMLVLSPALTPTLPVPMTDGMSRKLIGMFFEDRTMFSNTLSFA